MIKEFGGIPSEFSEFKILYFAENSSHSYVSLLMYDKYLNVQSQSKIHNLSNMLTMKIFCCFYHRFFEIMNFMQTEKNHYLADTRKKAFNR